MIPNPSFINASQYQHPMTEADLSRQVADFLDLVLPQDARFTHVASGGARSPAAAGKLKAEGVRPGCPDFVIVAPNVGAIWIELKAPRGRTSHEQKAWAESIIRTPSNHYALCRSLSEVDAALRAAGVIIKWARLT